MASKSNDLNTPTSSTSDLDVLPPAAASDTPSSASESKPMGEHCVTNPPLDPSEQSTGEVVKIGETECYISTPSETNDASLLLLLTNGMGHKSTNNQIQCDQFARDLGAFVVMPDLFKGDAAPNAATVTTAEQDSLGLLDQIKLKAAEGAKSFVIDMWLARHTPENTFPIVQAVLKDTEELYGDKKYSVAAGTYVVGYCFGAKFALTLAGTEGLKAVAVAHPTLATVEDFENIKVPITLAFAEDDPHVPTELRQKGCQALEAQNKEYESRVYQHVPHGFAVYGCYTDDNIKNSQREAYVQFTEFLGRH